MPTPAACNASQFALCGCNFVLELGDNRSTSSATGVDDAQSQSKFESSRSQADLKVSVYVTLGNHDNSSGP